MVRGEVKKRLKKTRGNDDKNDGMEREAWAYLPLSSVDTVPGTVPAAAGGVPPPLITDVTSTPPIPSIPAIIPVIPGVARPWSMAARASCLAGTVGSKEKCRLDSRLDLVLNVHLIIPGTRSCGDLS